MKKAKNANIYTGYVNENIIDTQKTNKVDMQAYNRINTDPFGSYTGVTTEGGKFEEPVQDVDDL